MTTFDASARNLIAAFDGEAAFLARNLTTGAELGYRPDAVMPTASTIKLLVLAELFRQAEAGAVDLAAPLPLLPDDRGYGSGILKDLSPGVLLSARDHAVLMIALSDNTSTAALVRLLGRERILSSAHDWGMASTAAGFHVPEGGVARDYAAASPRDIVRLLQLIAEDAIISPAACAAMREVLVTQQYHDQIARYLPFNQYARRDSPHPGPLVVLSKSGFMAGIRVDAGIVEQPGLRYVICLMTEGSADHSFAPEQAGAVLNGKLSRLVYDEWNWAVGQGLRAVLE